MPISKAAWDHWNAVNREAAKALVNSSSYMERWVNADWESVFTSSEEKRVPSHGDKTGP